jgi:hypothetical protein
MIESASRLILPVLSSASGAQLIHERNERLAGNVNHISGKGTSYLQGSLLQA